VIDDPLQEGTSEPFVLVDGHQFRPFLVRFMLNLIPLDGDALVKDVLGSPCGQVASQRHRNATGQHLTQHLAGCLPYDTGSSNTVSILLGNGNGTFQSATSKQASLYPDGLAVGDFNGDGKPDLAVVDNGSSSFRILFGTL